MQWGHAVNVAVAVLARRCWHIGRGHLCMRAVLVLGLGGGMASGARDPLGRRFVRQALHVGMAIHALPQRAVDGMLELVSVHKQAVGLAVHIYAERRVAVTGQAVFVGQLVLRLRWRDPEKKDKNQGLKQETVFRTHASTLRPHA